MGGRAPGTPGTGTGLAAAVPGRTGTDVGNLASARVEGVSIRTLATAVGLSPSRVHQLVTGADLDALDTALGELRAAGWPAPEDAESNEDIELDGRALIADRLNDEVRWLRRWPGGSPSSPLAGIRRRSTCAWAPTGPTPPTSWSI